MTDRLVIWRKVGSFNPLLREGQPGFSQSERFSPILAGSLVALLVSMRVLITTDGSGEATDAMRAAGRLLSKTGREVHVLYAVSETRGPKSGKVHPGAQHRAALETKRILLDRKSTRL